MARTCLTMLIVALSLTACDSEGPDGLPAYGTHTVTVTTSAGDSTTFSGDAFARLDGDTLRRISLYEAADDVLIGNRGVILTAKGQIVLRAETYAVGDFFDTASAFYATYSDFSGIQIGSPTTDSGFVTIETATETEVRGLFQFEATGRPFDENGPTRYSVRGSFEALVVRDPNEDG